MSTLDRVKDLATQLNQLDDELSKRIGFVEEALGALGLGITIEASGVVDEGGERAALGYGRIVGRWRLVVMTYDSDGDFNGSQPLSDRPRDERTYMLKQLPDLLARAAEEIESRIEWRKEILSEVDNVLPKLLQLKGKK